MMDCALTCIFVLVSTFTARSFEFTQKYQYSPNNLITDFMNLPYRMFLFTNYKFRVVFSCFPNFRRSPKPKWAPCGPFHPTLIRLQQTNKLCANMHGLKTFLFLEVCRLRKKKNILTIKRGFQKLASLIKKSPEPLCFDH
jgi:hypothetical protein